jgi:hypothetical protein
MIRSTRTFSVFIWHNGPSSLPYLIVLPVMGRQVDAEARNYPPSDHQNQTRHQHYRMAQMATASSKLVN